MAGKRSISLTNDTSAVMAVYIEPYPNEYRLRPGQNVHITGRPGKHQVEIIPFDRGMTIWFGEDPDPVVTTPDGDVLQPGDQRP
jgi:hypothetical protein